MENDFEKRFSYPMRSIIAKSVSLAMSSLATILGIGDLCFTLSSISPDSANISLLISVLPGDCFMIMGGILAFVMILNWDPILTITNDGIFVQLFLFWKKLVPWDEIIEIRSTRLPTIPGLRFIAVNRLSALHRLYGLQCWTTKPSIPIMDTMNNYHEALQLIQQMISTQIIP